VCRLLRRTRSTNLGSSLRFQCALINDPRTVGQEDARPQSRDVRQQDAMFCYSLPRRRLLRSDSSSLPFLRLSADSNKEFRDDFVARSLVPSSIDCHVPSVNHCDSALRQSGSSEQIRASTLTAPTTSLLSGCYSDLDDAGAIVTRLCAPPLPMKGENDLARIGIHIHNDLVDQGSKDAFLQADIRFRTAPQHSSSLAKSSNCSRVGAGVAFPLRWTCCSIRSSISCTRCKAWFQRRF